jgi:hypothetical protein
MSLSSYPFLSWLINLQPWRWKQHVPSKHWLTFNGLQIITSQKTELFNQNNVYPLHSCGCLWIPMVFPHQAVVLTKANVAFHRSVMCILVFVVNVDNTAIIFMWVTNTVFAAVFHEVYFYHCITTDQADAGWLRNIYFFHSPLQLPVS